MLCENCDKAMRCDWVVESFNRVLLCRPCVRACPFVQKDMLNKLAANFNLDNTGQLTEAQRKVCCYDVMAWTNRTCSPLVVLVFFGMSGHLLSCCALR